MSSTIDRSSTAPRPIHFCQDLMLNRSLIASSIHRAVFYIKRMGVLHLSFFFSFSLDRNLFFLASNFYLSLKSLYPLKFRPRSSLKHLVNVLNPFIFMHSCIFRPSFWVFEFFLGFLRFLWNFWVGLCWFVVICSCIASSLHYNNVSSILGLCAWLKLWVLLGWIGFLPLMLLIFAHHMFVHFFMHPFFSSFFLNLCSVSSLSLSLSLSLSFSLSLCG